MMDLIIKINVDGTIEGHPILLENMLLVDPNFNLQDMTIGYKQFIRTPIPEIGVYQILESETPDYVVDGDVVKDVWSIRDMSETEKQEKIINEKSSFIYKKWIFDELTCTFSPPYPIPDDEYDYEWDDVTESWIRI